MASDPTDLIRAVDERHVSRSIINLDGQSGEMCESCGLSWPCEVRRLRDALEASEFDRSVAQDTSDRLLRDAAESRAAIRVITDYAGADADVTDILRCIRELAADRRALAEANATIQRVKALADEWEATLPGDDPSLDVCHPVDVENVCGANLRRAIEGPQS